MYVVYNEIRKDVCLINIDVFVNNKYLKCFR